MMFAALDDMRFLYAIAIALAGTALVASPLMRPRAEAPPPAPGAEPSPTTDSQLAAEPSVAASNGVHVVDELITAQTVAGTLPRHPAGARAVARVAPQRQPRRSTLARVFFGSGEHRPRPFPQPGS